MNSGIKHRSNEFVWLSIRFWGSWFCFWRRSWARTSLSTFAACVPLCFGCYRLWPALDLCDIASFGAICNRLKQEWCAGHGRAARSWPKHIGTVSCGETIGDVRHADCWSPRLLFAFTWRVSDSDFRSGRVSLVLCTRLCDARRTLNQSLLRDRAVLFLGAVWPRRGHVSMWRSGCSLLMDVLAEGCESFVAGPPQTAKWGWPVLMGFRRRRSNHLVTISPLGVRINTAASERRWGERRDPFAS